MRGFIEIRDNNEKRKYINVSYIESIEEVGENRCIIYMMPNSLNDKVRDYHVIGRSYDEVIAKLKGGVKK